MKKSNLPTKLCPVCNRDFTWRKKWKVEKENNKNKKVDLENGRSHTQGITKYERNNN